MFVFVLGRTSFGLFQCDTLIHESGAFKRVRFRLAARLQLVCEVLGLCQHAYPRPDYTETAQLLELLTYCIPVGTATASAPHWNRWKKPAGAGDRHEPTALRSVCHLPSIGKGHFHATSALAFAIWPRSRYGFKFSAVSRSECLVRCRRTISREAISAKCPHTTPPPPLPHLPHTPGT